MAVTHSGVQNMVIAATAADLDTGWPDKTLVWQEDTSALKMLDGGLFVTLNGGSLADGVYGQITVSSGGTVWTVTPTTTQDFLGQQASNFRIENRTSDPGSPTVGQIWLRTDL